MRSSDTTGPSRGSRRRRSDGFDATESLEEALDRAAESQALIVLAVPVPALPILLGHIRESAAADCPLTDVISVKGAVLDEVKAAGLLPRFVGGHPMAGTARSGWAAGHGAAVRRRAVGDQRGRTRRRRRVGDGDGLGAGLRRRRRAGEVRRT